ncbi:MAG: hypothetical protein ACE5R6_09775 [Candidatus Heimdallarchaeota archaeon]
MATLQVSDADTSFTRASFYSFPGSSLGRVFSQLHKRAGPARPLTLAGDGEVKEVPSATACSAPTLFFSGCFARGCA